MSPSFGPLQFIALDIPGRLPRTQKGKQHGHNYGSVFELEARDTDIEENSRDHSKLVLRSPAYPIPHPQVPAQWE